MIALREDDRFDLEGIFEGPAGPVPSSLNTHSHLKNGRYQQVPVRLSQNSIQLGSDFTFALGDWPAQFVKGDRFRIELTVTNSINWWWWREDALMYFVGFPQEPLRLDPNVFVDLWADSEEGVVNVEGSGRAETLVVGEELVLGEYTYALVRAPREATPGIAARLWAVTNSDPKFAAIARDHAQKID